MHLISEVESRCAAVYKSLGAQPVWKEMYALCPVILGDSRQYLYSDKNCNWSQLKIDIASWDIVDDIPSRWLQIRILNRRHRLRNYFFNPDVWKIWSDFHTELHTIADGVMNYWDNFKSLNLYVLVSPSEVRQVSKFRLSNEAIHWHLNNPHMQHSCVDCSFKCQLIASSLRQNFDQLQPSDGETHT